MVWDMTIIALKNDTLSVLASSKGAELQSVVRNGAERLWSGDPAVWGRRAPLLFPLIGRLRNGWYANDGKRVGAPMHGFCRDRAFAVEQVSDSHVRFETVSDAVSYTHLDVYKRQQHVLAEPVVRNGKQATVGYAPDVWKTWE